MEILLAILLFTLDFTTAIECNFIFIESDPNYPADHEFKFNASSQPSTTEPFECEEPVKEFTQSRVNVFHKIQFDFKEDDDYESVEVCETIRRKIYPKALNNIYNQLTPVVNTIEVSQSLDTEVCSYQNRSCSDSSATLPSVCIQKYVKTSLQAFNDQRQVYNEFFYFPSLCACQLVNGKRPRETSDKREPMML